MSRPRMTQAGFTLVELMLAMAIFIAITILFTVGFIAINRTFSRTMVRKQLAESVQVLNEDLTQALRASGVSTAALSCRGGEDECPSPNSDMSGDQWNVLCVGGVRFYWSETAGGMYKDELSCQDDELDIKAAKSIFSQQFTVDVLNVYPVTDGSARLYDVSGIVRTKEKDAFDFDESNFFKTVCRGSSASPLAQTCAIEKFSFIINPQGETL